MSSKLSFLFYLAVGLTISGSVAARAQDESGSAQADPIREQTIYIPYEKLRRTFEQQGRGVFLPYEKFQELWKAARDRQPRPRELDPPVKAVITEIDNEARVEKDVVRVTAELKIDLLGKGWLEVPLRLSDAALLSATIDGNPALLVVDQQGGQKLLLRKDADVPKQVILQLEYAQSIKKAPGQNSVAFQAPLAPVNRWRIRIPEAGVKVNVHPMLAATEVPGDRRDDAADNDDAAPSADGSPGTDTAAAGQVEETVVLAFVGAAPSVRIDWTPKAEGASGLDALVSVQTEQEVTIDEGVMRTRTRLAYEISRAELSQLCIRVPADQKVVNVVDANVRQWKVETGDDGQTITVGMFQPAHRAQTVRVELEKFHSQTDKVLVLPTVQAVDVGRQRGIVVVRLAEGLRAEPSQRAGLLHLDADDVPATLKGRPWTFSYRYAALPFELALRVEKIKPRIVVDQLVEAFLEPEKLTMALFAKYNVQRAGVFELQLHVPTGLEVLRVRGHKAAGVQAAVVESHLVEADQDGGSRLKVNLASKAQGAVGLLVELVRRLDDPNLLNPTDESSRIDIVPVRVADASVQRASGRLVVYAPESLRVAIGQLAGLRNISFEEAFRDTASVRDGRFGQLRHVQAFAFSEGPASVQLQAQRRQPYVTVRQLLVERIDPGVVKCEATFFFEIRYSGVRSLRIDIPAEIADRVRNETKSLRESTLATAEVAEGYAAWSLTGETELLGNMQCKLTWETPIDELGIGDKVDLPVPQLIPRDVARADGQIVLVKAETIDVQPKGKPRGLDPIDPQHELIAGVQVEDAAVALEFHDDWELTLTATRYQLEVLKHTSIEKAVLRMVITRSDRVAVQALYRMRSNRQRLQVELPLALATGQIEFYTDPLRINGRRVTLERGDNDTTFFVPLVGIEPDTPFVLELRYTMPGAGARLTYPVFPDDPAVQEVNLVAYVPQELTYLGKRGPWTDETIWRYGRLLQPKPGSRPVRPDQLIERLTQGVSMTGRPTEDFPTDGQPLLFSTLRPNPPDVGALRLTLVSGKLLSGLVFGLVALAGVLLLGRPAADRIVAVCGLVALLVLAGVFLPTLATALLSGTLLLAAVIVVLLWLAVFSARTLPGLTQRQWKWPSRKAKAPGAAPPDSPAEAEQESPPSARQPADQPADGRADEQGGSGNA